MRAVGSMFEDGGFIGARAVVLPGVTIGRGAVVGQDQSSPVLCRIMSSSTQKRAGSMRLADLLRRSRRARQLTASAARVAVLRVEFPGLHTEGKVYVGPGCEIYLAPGSTITLRGCSLNGGITLITGPGATIDLAASVVGRGSVIVARDRITVGTDSKIAEMVVVRDANHQRPLTCGTFVTAPVSIGCEVWLGAKSTILAGVSIGDGSTIGAGAVVTRNVPAGVTAVGVPARVLG